MNTTVIIATYRREQYLQLCLEHLARQTTHDFRTLIVDNAGSEATRRLADSFGVGYCFEPVAGASKARNRGIALATTPYLLFLDDDTLADPGVVATVEDYFDHHPEVSGIGGRSRVHYLAPMPAWVRAYTRRGDAPRPGLEGGELGEGQYIHGFLMAFRRKDLEEVGNFSTDFGPRNGKQGAGEDTEVHFRLRKAGYRVDYVPDLTCRHIYRRDEIPFQKQLRVAYVRGRDSGRFRGKPHFGLAGYLRKSLLILGYDFPRLLWRCLRQPDYYWQNLLIDTGRELAYALGRFSTFSQRSGTM